jgi:hypothetical protein
MNRLLIFFIVLLSNCFNLYSLEISQISKLEELLKECDEQTLVVFDVDEVILSQEDIVLRPCGAPYVHKWLLSSGVYKDKEKVDLLTSIVMLQSKRCIIDPDMPGVIRDLQERGVKAIGLTATKIKGQGKIASVPNWRIEELKTLNVSFENAFPWASNQHVPLQSDVPLSPLYKSGIIFSGNYPKGEVLAAFLDMIGWMPEKVIFIDDRPDNIKSVEEEMKKLPEIVCIPVLYQGAKRLQIDIDEGLANFQLTHLLEQEEWLSDSEAQELMSTCEQAG